VHLVQILLPVTDEARAPGASLFTIVRRELTDAFGGVTAYVRSPAIGLWRDDDGDVARDDVVIVEVVVDRLDERWWADYRRILEKRFRQELIHIRALAIQIL
jgi:hypothetical protein